MELLGVGIVALCGVFFAALVQKSNKEFALLISLAGAVLLLLTVLGRAEPLLRQVEGLAEVGALEGEAVKLVLRAVGITVVGQVVARLCKDAGESALSYTVELAARTAVWQRHCPPSRKYWITWGRLPPCKDVGLCEKTDISAVLVIGVLDVVGSLFCISRRGFQYC